MKTCEAFSKMKLETVLAVPKFVLFDSNNEDPFFYYGVKKLFKIKRIFSVRLIRLGPIGFFLETLLFSMGLIFSSDFWRADYVFSRDEALVAIASFLGRKTLWETHTGSYNFFAKVALNRSKLIVSISRGLKDFYISKGVLDSKIIVSPDGVDLEDFNIAISKTEARKLLNLPQDKKIVLYAGRLDGWKGVETFFEASKEFQNGVMALVVGGEEYQVELFSKKYPTVSFEGLKPYKDLPVYQKSADVLVIPNTATNDISRLYTSPLKVFTYMASGVPVVASELPSIRELLNPRNSVLVEPDNSRALLDGINVLLDDPVKADIIAKQALADVAQYSWLSRAETIVSHLP